MNRRLLPALRARRPALYGAATAIVLLLAVTAYLVQTAPVSAGARSVAAAPPPAASAPASAPVSEPLAPSLLVRGRVLDFDTGAPLRGTSIWAGASELVTDADGRFGLQTVPGQPAAVIVKRPGYERKSLTFSGAETTVRLRPQVIRAAYLTYYGVGERAHSRARARARGPHRAERRRHRRQGRPRADPLPHRGAGRARGRRAGAGHHQGLRRACWPRSRREGVYTIARIVTFKDNVLANHRKDLAIIDTRTGRPWLDNEKLAWVDPFREEVWDYVIAIAKEAAAKGFDEIQFDYVRFPTDGRLSAARYSQPNNSADAAADHRRLPRQGTPRAGPDGRLPRRRSLRLHRLQRQRHRHRAADRGDGAAPRLHLPHGLSLGLPPGHPRLPQPGGASLRDRPRERAAHPRSAPST